MKFGEVEDSLYSFGTLETLKKNYMYNRAQPPLEESMSKLDYTFIRTLSSNHNQLEALFSCFNQWSRFLNLYFSWNIQKCLFHGCRGRRSTCIQVSSRLLSWKVWMGEFVRVTLLAQTSTSFFQQFGPFPRWSCHDSALRGCKGAPRNTAVVVYYSAPMWWQRKC